MSNVLKSYDYVSKNNRKREPILATLTKYSTIEKLLLILYLAILPFVVQGFTVHNLHGNKKCSLAPQRHTDRNKLSQLGMDMGGIGKFFNLNNNGNNGESEGGDDDDEDYLGCTNIFKIDVKSLKVGGCRLYLSLFFMGESNKPEKGAWRMNQNGDGGIDLYYKDTSGALIIEFKEDAILVNRLGSSPSMEYLMQESSMLNGMLDQLDEIAMDNSISETDRLICIEGDEINLVRESLSFT